MLTWRGWSTQAINVSQAYFVREDRESQERGLTWLRSAQDDAKAGSLVDLQAGSACFAFSAQGVGLYVCTNMYMERP
jgi:hypothetical protein